VVQTGSNELDNLGDQAMLEVLLARVRAGHAGARFSVFARDAEKVRSLGIGVEQIPVEQKPEWAVLRAVYLAARRALPTVDRLVRTHKPRWFNSLFRMKARALVNPAALNRADILLVSGGGFITDVFPGQAWPVLERMHAAIRQNIPFALLGQGIGPIRDPALLRKARAVLPHAKLIAVRETLHSLPLLLELGVSPRRIVVTGDDAIEPAYRARNEALGKMLGVNFRVAEYAGITQSDVDRLRSPIRKLAAKLGTELISLPVCIANSAESASDATVASHLVYSRATGSDDFIPATPAALIERISECRLVVTGSYHAAVFALAQGIPAVCVFNTQYYENKFRGLAEQFGDGCELIDKSGAGFEAALSLAITYSWKRAADVRPSLLRAAARQIADGHEAYARLSSIVDGLQRPSDKSRRGLVA